MGEELGTQAPGLGEGDSCKFFFCNMKKSSLEKSGEFFKK